MFIKSTKIHKKSEKSIIYLFVKNCVQIVLISILVFSIAFKNTITVLFMFFVWVKKRKTNGRKSTRHSDRNIIHSLLVLRKKGSHPKNWAKGTEKFLNVFKNSFHTESTQSS